MDIIIGREPQTNDLQINIAGRLQSLGRPGQVPRSVSRQHCRLSIDQRQQMTLVNLKPENVTKVDGLPIQSKRIGRGDAITLGMDDYRLDLEAILSLVPGLPKEYDINALRPVWNRYYETKKKIQQDERRQILYRSAIGIIPMLAIGLSFIGALVSIRIPLYAVAIVLTAYFLIRAFRSKSAERLEALDDELQAQYRCPNPDCHRFLGYTKYHVLLTNGSCPYCHARFKE